MPTEPLIIGLTGTNASGKGVVADILKKRGFSYHSLSDVIRDDLSAKDIAPTRENMIKRGNELRSSFGPAALAKEIGPRITSPRAVIDSIRNLHEVEELKKLDNFKLVSVDAPLEIRYKRAQKRGRIENAANLEQFKAMEEREKSQDDTAQQIDKCMKVADHTIINDGTIEELEKKIDDLIG